MTTTPTKRFAALKATEFIHALYTPKRQAKNPPQFPAKNQAIAFYFENGTKINRGPFWYVCWSNGLLDDPNYKMNIRLASPEQRDCWNLYCQNWAIQTHTFVGSDATMKENFEFLNAPLKIVAIHHVKFTEDDLDATIGPFAKEIDPIKKLLCRRIVAQFRENFVYSYDKFDDLALLSTAPTMMDDEHFEFYEPIFYNKSKAEETESIFCKQINPKSKSACDTAEAKVFLPQHMGINTVTHVKVPVDEQQTYLLNIAKFASFVNKYYPIGFLRYRQDLKDINNEEIEKFGLMEFRNEWKYKNDQDEYFVILVYGLD